MKLAGAVLVVALTLAAGCGDDDGSGDARLPGSPETIGDTTSSETATASATPTPAPTSSATPTAPLADGVPAQVIDVIDGDTIDVIVGGVAERVRYIGIDTPEFEQCYYNQATMANAALVQDREVFLVSDPVADRDSTEARRLLRYVFVGGVFVNERLVADGYADATSVFPERRFRMRLLAAEASAISGNLGIWGNCPGLGQRG